jgi:hypothetical protein
MTTDPLKRRIKAQYPRLWRVLRALHPRNFGIAYLSLCHFVDTQKFVTAFTGPLYERTRFEIDLDITYACNLKCFGCNRCCGIAPSGDCLNLEQVRKFIRESSEKGVPWQTIGLAGGEPTLHPEFFRIIEELIAFKKSRCPEVTIAVYTNKFGDKVNDVLARVGGDIVVWDSAKKSNKNCFQAMNLAPKDSALNRFADFSSGCWITRDCGIVLSPYGYYQCAQAAAIDRVFGFDLGRKSLPDLSDSMRDLMQALCGYCGYFKYFNPKMLDKDLMSSSWRKACENYKISKPRMTFYR